MKYLTSADYKSSGYIYIASYDGHPNALKIGLTKTCPIKRVKSMNDSTYTIGTFVLIESYRTANVHDVERLIHNELSDSKICKEFFSVSIDEAKDTVSKFIMSEDFSESNSLVENCIHLIDFDKDQVGKSLDKELAVIGYKKALFYVVNPLRYAQLLRAEKELNDLAKKLRGE